MQQYHVRVASDDLVFSAGHFLTVEGDTCEPLHGHDYRVAAEVQGPLNENHYVIDFVALRDALRAVIAELDHRVLLPGEHPSIYAEPGPTEVEVTFGQRRWVLPSADCVVLPIASTTTELLAQHVGRQLLARLELQTGTRPPLVRIEISESFGFSAVCELRDE